MKTFFDLIDQLRDPAQPDPQGVESEILAQFQAEKSIFALDMSGYSFSARRGGILQHLCKIREMQAFCRPIIAAHGGEIVRLLADNVLAVFNRPDPAIEAALDMQRALGNPHPSFRRDWMLSVAIGIDHGKILLVPGADCFGDAVNIAYKLGEDVARGGEILITENARTHLTGSFELESLDLSVSGLRIPAHRVIV
jgi:class 3 adenylate cyclase